jgi:5'-3' exonuclease
MSSNIIETMDDLDDGIDCSSWGDEVERAKNANNLLIVDGLNLAYRYLPRGKSLGKAPDFAADLLNTINSLARSYDCREIVFLSDLRGSVYREGIHPLYKSDRKIAAEKKTPEEKESFRLFFQYYTEVAIPFIKASLRTIQLLGVEADDVACYLVEAFEDGKHFDHIWLISSDGDWDELLSERCSRFATSSRKEFTLKDFYELKGCDTTDQFTNIKAIMGDKGDSVYGVDGIGIKRAYNLIREYGDVFGVADALPIAGSQLFIKALNESYDKLMLNLELVDLRSFHVEAIVAAGAEHLQTLERNVQEIKENKHD